MSKHEVTEYIGLLALLILSPGFESPAFHLVGEEEDRGRCFRPEGARSRSRKSIYSHD